MNVIARCQLAHLLIPLVVAMAVSACALNYVDAEGTRHIVGLAYLQLRAPEPAGLVAGKVLDITTIGMSAYRTQEIAGITIGFNREISAFLQDNKQGLICHSL